MMPRLIRPAGCSLAGTVNVSSLSGFPLPERPGQQRNHLTPPGSLLQRT
jgi:hypothetical protein